MNRISSLLALCLLCSSSCAGRAVDLDRSAPGAPAASAAPSGEPSLPVSAEQFSSVWVDSERLYWLTSFGSFQSCLKADCEHTTLTYLAEDDLVYTAVVAEGRVFWIRVGTAVHTCPSEGCAKQPGEVVDDPGIKSAIFVHRDYVYWSSDFDIYRCPATGCAATPEVVALDAFAPHLAFDETHAYWMGPDGILSVPLDGSKPPTAVIQLTDPDTFDPFDRGDLAVSNGYLYWRALHKVFRCPIASCGAAPPTLLVTAEGPISDLAVDDSGVYWLEEAAVHSCPLSGCEQSLALTPSTVAQRASGPLTQSRFALDSNAVYWIEESPPIKPTALTGGLLRKTAR